MPELNPIAFLILNVLEIYKWIVIVAVIVSWLIAFNVINLHNQFARQIVRVLDALTEPLFRQVRRLIPPVGGLDLSPLVIFVVILTLEYAITDWSPLASRGW